MCTREMVLNSVLKKIHNIKSQIPAAGIGAKSQSITGGEPSPSDFWWAIAEVRAMTYSFTPSCHELRKQ